MANQITNSLRLLFPQWQGGNNAPYHFGARLLAWLAPESDAVTVEVDVSPPDEQPLENENGIVGRRQVIRQLAEASELIRIYNPETIVTLGGDCLVSLAPFSYLSEKYGDRLGVLWIDSHPDVMTPNEFSHSHAHVLGALLGSGDAELTQGVSHPVSPSRVMIAGIHQPLDYEANFIEERGIATCSPVEVKAGGNAIAEWVEKQNIDYLAIHLDLDVLDPSEFRSVLFARPGRTEHEFGDVAEGKLSISDVLTIVNLAGQSARPVGLTIAEHLPWDAFNLRNMLNALPLLR